MAERQSGHRQELESAVVAGNVKAQGRGQLLGAGIAGLAIVSGAWLLHEGRPIEGFVSMFGPLSAMVALFIWGRRQQQTERRLRLEALNRPPEA